MMPGLDGWALYRAIRADQRQNTIGVILMSAGRHPPSTIADPRATFVNKPFSVFEMLDALGHVI